MDFIRIRGARTHNLKGVDVDIPRDRLVVITGLSGSGKSSLAFDTVYAEGQRRYVESLSAYARQFLSVMEKPDVEHIEGLSPAISIEQKSTSHNPRSTVGTITEIHDYLRLLFARVGEPRCPDHGVILEAQTVSQMVDAVMARPHGERLMLLAPVVDDRKGEHVRVVEGLRSQGFIRARIDGRLHELDDPIELDAKRRHTIEAVVDRFRVRDDLALRLAESFETALALSDGRAVVAPLDSDDDGDGEDTVFSARFACHVCGYAIPELEPRIFSFNNPAGACQRCDGLGVQTFFDPARIVAHPELSLPGGAVRGWDRRNFYYFQMVRSLAAHYGFDIDTPFRDLPPSVREVILNGSGTEAIRFTFRTERRGDYTRTHPFEGVIPNMERRYRETESAVVRDELAKYLGTRACESCGGARLNRGARNVFVAGETLPALAALPIRAAHDFFNPHRTRRSPGRDREAHPQGDHPAPAVPRRRGARLPLPRPRRGDALRRGGPAHPAREPDRRGAGRGDLHPRRALDRPASARQPPPPRHARAPARHRQHGHRGRARRGGDQQRRSRHRHGAGSGRARRRNRRRRPSGRDRGESRIADRAVPLAPACHRGAARAHPVRSAAADPRRRRPGNNLAGVDVEVPVGLMTCVTGVSGSGKSTLVNDTLYRAAARALNNAAADAAPFDRLEGLEMIDRVVDIDQSPIGRTPRSNPATYTGLFTPIRDLFAATPEARSRGYGPGRFSFNVRGGRCEACSGDGVIKVEMHFLPDVYVPCDVCAGRRFNRETLDIRYKGRTIHEVLEMTVEEARAVFDAVPMVARKLQTLVDVGLSYIRLGQRATTLSGGEAQRVKLSRELSKRDTGRTLYILDEPTTGLHFHDTEQLLRVLHRLRDRGNTVVVIEHNLEVVKTADWIVDLGPEGGDRGGRVVVAGTPETVAACGDSHTGYHLSAMLRAPDVAEDRQAVSSRA